MDTNDSVTSPSATEFSTDRLTQTTQQSGLSLAIGRFDDDESDDFIVANYNPGTVTLRTNDGRGGFQREGQEIATGDGPLFVLAEDLDQSGSDDIVVVNQLADSISILLNDGTGGFANRLDIPLSSADHPNPAPSSAVAGDFDGDGDIDLAVVLRESAVAMLLNRGTPFNNVTEAADLFDPVALLDIEPGAFLTSISAEDLDADGRLDLAIATSLPQKLHLYFGQEVSANPTDVNTLFSDNMVFDTPFIPVSLESADLEAGSEIDIALVGLSVSQPGATQIAVLQNKGDRQFGFESALVQAESSLTSLAVADLDGDNRSELITSTTATRNVSVFSRGQSGQLESDQSIPIAQIPVTFQYSVAVGDVDADDQLDLLVSDANGVSILRNAMNGHVVDLTSDLLINSLEFGVSPAVTDGPTVTVSPTGPNGVPDPADLASGPQPTSWATQRSSLREIVVDLGRSVAMVNVNDIVLRNLGIDADANTLIALDQEQLNLSADGRQVTLTLMPDQLGDGVYQLELMPALTGGEAFTITGNHTNQFYGLAGDWNGSGSVNIQDFATFAYWFGQSVGEAPEYVDLNGSGAINIQDFAAFAANFGKSLNLGAPPESESIERTNNRDGLLLIDTDVAVSEDSDSVVDPPESPSLIPVIALIKAPIVDSSDSVSAEEALESNTDKQRIDDIVSDQLERFTMSQIEDIGGEKQETSALEIIDLAIRMLSDENSDSRWSMTGSPDR